MSGSDLMARCDRPRAGVLVIDMIDRDHIEVSARGRFPAEERDAVAKRLEQFISCGFKRLRIDFSRTVALDPVVGTAFARAERMMVQNGGRLEVVNAGPTLLAGLGLQGPLDQVG